MDNSLLMSRIPEQISEHLFLINNDKLQSGIFTYISQN